MHLLIVIGTRPNFIKVTRFRKVLDAIPGAKLSLVHTGQHYDRAMSQVFFDQFELKPDHVLDLHSGSGGMQFAQMTTQLVETMERLKPDVVLVPGDVNSTLAGALAAQRLGIPLGHLEAGLRSFDRSMPEEINRILVDQLSSMHFVTEESGLQHLKSEGLDTGHNVHFVGNTMIDTLVAFSPQIEQSTILADLGLGSSEAFYLLTMHRPATVDNKEGCSFVVDLIHRLCADANVVFPIHPRTQKNLETFGLDDVLNHPKLKKTGPLDYFAFQHLISTAKTVITDSGGIQEETTFRQVPCITLRPNTERPSTTTLGTNQMLTTLDADAVMEAIRSPREGVIPPHWDGHATERIVEVLQSL